MSPSDTAGALAAELVPTSTALLVIDMQNDLQQPSYPPMVERLAGLLAAARSAGVYVVYVKNRVLPGGLSTSPAERLRRERLGLTVDVTVDGTPGQEVIDALKPEPGEPEVLKHRLDSFHGTALETLLRVRGIRTVLVTGVATHGCVTSTSYAAQARDFTVVVVRDCVASWDEAVHDACLTVLEHTMGFVAGSDEVLAAWSRTGARV